MQHRSRRSQAGRWLVLLLAALVVSCQLVGGSPPEDDWLHAASGSTPVVLLYWNPPSETEPSGYNLYRRPSAEAEYPATPVNGPEPISRVSSCSELMAVVPDGSPEWALLMDAFESCNAIFDPAYKTYNPAIFDALAVLRLPLRLARGWGYEDRGVTPGQDYVYQLRGLQADGTEVVLGPEVRVVAGEPRLPDVPRNLTAIPGDHRVLCLWDEVEAAYDYVVTRRAAGPGAGYQTVGIVSAFTTINADLQGVAISPQPGFVDYQRWDEEGEAIDHTVEGSAVSGPENGVTYSYRVASRDILGQRGGWSSAQSATPMDHTPPRAPTELSVDPLTDPVSPGLVVSWRKVTRDVDGHIDAIPTYKVYRSDALDRLEDIEALPTHLVWSVTADPTDERTVVLSWTDTDPAIVPDFGETDFWYCVRCVDAQGNEGAPSASIAGRVPDTRPPGPTAMSGSEGYSDHIRVLWSPNPEPDLAGYQIYRGVCDRGEPYRPVLQERACDFVLVGQVLLGEAGKRLEEEGSIYFDDPSVPADSPICYAYWVRAFDMARNLYPGGAGQGCPAAGEYVCQRLLEATPPPAPTISALKARSDSVHIEWVSSPIQDLGAFHVYRSEEESGAPEFVACVFLDGRVSREKWRGLRPSCADIPAEPYPTSVFRAYDDEGVEPNQEYWYRVAAVDWLGNESGSGDVESIPAISTFTYSRDLPEAPTVLSPTEGSATECGLLVRWTPPFDSGNLAGFVVFRSSSSSGPYRQVSGVIAGNEFLDESAIRGRSYWYCVQAMGLDGKLSPPSETVEHRY